MGQTLGRAGQQGMGSRPGAPQQALHLQTPALLQSGAAGEAQGGGTLVLTLKLQHTPAGAGSRAQIGLETAVKAHAQAGIGWGQQAQRVARTRGRRAESKQDQQAGQSQQHRQGGPIRDGSEPGRGSALRVQWVSRSRLRVRGEGLPGQGWRFMEQGSHRSWATR